MGKKIAIYILNFFIVIDFVALSMVHFISITILDKQYVTKCLKESNYYEKIYYNIQDEFKNYIMQSGLEESILDNLYEKEKVDSDIGQVIDSIYENKDINIDTQTLRKTLDDRIKQELEQNNRTPDGEEELAIQTFEDTIVEVYENGIVYAKEYIETIGKMYKKVNNLMHKAEIGLIIIGIILPAIILIISKSKRETIKAEGIAWLATGILQIILRVLIGDRMHHILILNSAFSESLIYIATHMLTTIFSAGIIISVVGIITIIVCNIPKMKKEKTAEE